MNKLFIVGNGFDLAHGLETKYEHFILWYINNAFKELAKRPIYEDELIKISNNQITNYYIFKNISEFTKYIEFARRNSSGFNFEYKSIFFEKLTGSIIEPRWVDIEAFYYSEILNLYKQLEKGNVNRHKDIDVLLQNLNSSFNFIKLELIKYLETIDSKGIEILPEIRSHLSDEMQFLQRNNCMFLIFNYTDTIENYINEKVWNLNYIHGKLNDVNHPIIFGYGDDMDMYYEKIEQLNDNNFLINMKSFGYFQTSNYQKFSNFLSADNFEVVIIGHSCGLSDRILLNSVFEHTNCVKIKLYYHQINELRNDYFDKTLEISRHFKSIAKGIMRNKVVSFADSKPLIKYIPI